MLNSLGCKFVLVIDGEMVASMTYATIVIVALDYLQYVKNEMWTQLLWLFTYYIISTVTSQTRWRKMIVKWTSKPVLLNILIFDRAKSQKPESQGFMKNFIVFPRKNKSRCCSLCLEGLLKFRVPEIVKKSRWNCSTQYLAYEQQYWNWWQPFDTVQIVSRDNLVFLNWWNYFC